MRPREGDGKDDCKSSSGGLSEGRHNRELVELNLIGETGSGQRVGG